LYTGNNPVYPGFLFRAKPTLMTRPASGEMMDAIFSSDEEDARGRLLKIMQNFLISESEKHALSQKSMCLVFYAADLIAEPGYSLMEGKTRHPRLPTWRN